jgi:RimJ/RimL family protein N-acetyltransferase
MSRVPTERFIVAEISKNWIANEQYGPFVIAELFEQAINVNDARGYRLLQFQLHRLMTSPDELNETIIAVFERHVS